MLNKDEIYLICKKLDLRSTMNFSFISKKFRSIIILHETLLKEKFTSFHPARRCLVTTLQIKYMVRSMIAKLENRL
jgi:hypothetical protein